MRPFGTISSDLFISFAKQCGALDAVLSRPVVASQLDSSHFLPGSHASSLKTAAPIVTEIPEQILMRRPRFSRMPFAGSVAVLAVMVLSGCAAGGDGASADWAPVARQTTGHYQRVCTVAPSATTPIQAVTRQRAPSAIALAAPAVPGFDLRADDHTLSVSLARWASMAGVTVRWMTALQVPVTADSHVAGELPSAMKSIMAAIADAGYPITILQVADGKTWIVTDKGDWDRNPALENASPLAQRSMEAGDARAH
ncbi:TPA: TcpQ domain-containing protein [Burkholderia orbicola]|nr:hypothetical protein DF039_30545 [Burkholderia cenocepacia]